MNSDKDVNNPKTENQPITVTKNDEPLAKKLKVSYDKSQQSQTQQQKYELMKNKNDLLYELTINEAKLKLERAKILNKAATVNLEEAEYLKQEAKLKMIYFSKKLKRIHDGNNEDFELDD